MTEDLVETLVCVGGIADGQRVTIPRAAMVIRAYPSSEALPKWDSANPPPAHLDSRPHCTYERMSWRLPGDVVRWILIPHGSDKMEALDRLIKGYRR